MEFEHMSCVELALGGLNFISRGGWLTFSLGGLQSQAGDMLYVTLIFCICLAERGDGSLPTGRLIGLVVVAGYGIDYSNDCTLKQIWVVAPMA